MRFKALHIAGFALLMLFTILLLTRQSLTAMLVTSILFVLVIIVQLVFALINDELSFTHATITAVLFLSLAYLLVNYLGPATITTFFLASTLILTYFITTILIIVSNWRDYKVLDKVVDVMSAEQKNEQKESVPAQSLIEEPPHFTAKKGDEGEWIEIKIQKPNATKKKFVKKKTKK